MNQNDQQALQRYLSAYFAWHPNWHGRTPEAIAEELLSDAAFGDIRLAGWLRSPNGAEILKIVEATLPFPENIQAKIMADAIMIAAQKRTRPQVIKTVFAGALLVVLIFGISNGR